MIFDPKVGRKEDREQRMVARANLGLGRGGGYFERDDAARHRGRL